MIAGLIDDLLTHTSCSEERIENAIDAALRGNVPAVQVAGLLVALRSHRLTPALLALAARTVRAHQVPFSGGLGAVDTCGTGGDRSGTFNVSTAAAFAVAACGVPVAKHGNRAASSSSGSADVLERLGFRIDVPPEVASACLEETGFCFLFAPVYHPSLARVAPVRRELGVATLFNVLGPLLNPAGVRLQVIGVSDPEQAETVAGALALMGASRALVVHCEGLDELGLHAPTRGSFLDGGHVGPFEFDPAEFGIAPAPIEALRCEGPASSAALVRGILAGRAGPALDVAALNAGAALFVAGAADSVAAGFHMAAGALRDGRARRVFERARDHGRADAGPDAGREARP